MNKIYLLHRHLFDSEHRLADDPLLAQRRHFLSHPRTDHMGHINALFASGWASGNTRHLMFCGPSGRTLDICTANAAECFLKSVNWHEVTREYKFTPVSGQVELTTFVYKSVDQVVYEENDVVIRSYMAIHTGGRPAK